MGNTCIGHVAEVFVVSRVVVGVANINGMESSGDWTVRNSRCLCTSVLRSVILTTGCPINGRMVGVYVRTNSITGWTVSDRVSSLTTYIGNLLVLRP